MPTSIQTPEPPTIPSSPVEPSHKLSRFTAADFLQMIERDLLPDTTSLELWNGLILEKMDKKQAHSVSSMKILRLLTLALPAGWSLSVENPIGLDPEKVPLPDLVVLRGQPDDYRTRVPGPRDVGFVVELADSSLRFDTTEKLAAYARAGIPAYWVVNLVANIVQVYDNPVVAEGRYASEQTFAIGGQIPLTLDGVAVGPVAASDVLPQV